MDDIRSRILDVVEGFRAAYPAEVASLRVRIDKRLPNKKRNKFKLWASEKLGSRKEDAYPIRYLT